MHNDRDGRRRAFAHQSSKWFSIEYPIELAKRLLQV